MLFVGVCRSLCALRCSWFVVRCLLLVDYCLLVVCPVMFAIGWSVCDACRVLCSLCVDGSCFLGAIVVVVVFFWVLVVRCSLCVVR